MKTPSNRMAIPQTPEQRPEPPGLPRCPRCGGRTTLAARAPDGRQKVACGCGLAFYLDRT